jgi:hypothetical protein
MTPKGDDAPVTIERKLFAVADVDGKETEVPFPADKNNGQQITLEPGEQKGTVHIPISNDAKPGNKYRVQISVASGGNTPAVSSKDFTVN